MIFGRPLIAKVLSGEKTQTRRLVQPAHRTDHFRARMERAVQTGRGKTAIARIRLVAVGRDDVTAITDLDVAAEGFPGRAAFARYWLQLHDPDPRMQAAVQRDPAGWNGITDTNVLEHFEARHTGRRVWVLEFELVREAPPLLLAARPSSGGAGRGFVSGRELGQRARANAASRPYDPWPQDVDLERAAQIDAAGYTEQPSQALRGEPEVMDATGTVGALEARQAWIRDHAEAAAQLRALPLRDRVENARRLPRGMVNAAITGDLAVLDRLAVLLDEHAAAGRPAGVLEQRARRRLDAIEEKLAARVAA